MIKKTINMVLALTLIVAGMTVVKVDAAAAADKSYEWGVTYNGSKFLPTDGKEYDANKAKLKDVMPGDTIEYVVTYENKDKDGEAIDFYLNANVVKSLEDTSSAAGGAYTFKILNNGVELFDSETGGDAVSAEGAVGLNLVNGNQGAYFSLGSVPINGSGNVVVSIKLDGNSQTNDYMSAIANLDLKFVAEPTNSLSEKKTIINQIVNIKTVKVEDKKTEKRSIVKQVVKTLDNGTEVVAIDDSDVPLAGPQTGDKFIPMAICSAMFVIGMFLIVWYAAICVNSKKKEVS